MKSKESVYKTTNPLPTVDFSFKDISELDESLLYVKARSGKRMPQNAKQSSPTNVNNGKDSTNDNVNTKGSHMEDENNTLGMRKSIIERISRKQEPQQTRGVTLSLSHQQEQKVEEEEDQVKKVKTKYMGTALKLSENRIASLAGLDVAIRSAMQTPEQITWLDLSFNMISSLEGLPTYLPLKSLYLHGNRIQDIKTLAVLRNFKDLTSLTLHGCPVAEEKNYRYQVLALLPKLKKLDFSGVTPKDIETSKTFVQFFGTKFSR